MLIVFFLLIVGVNAFLAARGKTFPFVIFLTNVFIWFLITCSRDEIDLPSCLIGYDKSFLLNNVGLQYGFYGLMDAFRSLGFSFFEFREILVGIGLLFIFLLTRKLAANPHLVYTSYLLYLIFLDYIQLRNFIACCVFCLALVILLQQRQHWRILFVLFILLASSFHSSFIVYLMFLVIPSNEWNKSKIVKSIAIFAVIFSVFAVFSRNSISFVSDVISFVDVERSARYADKATNFGGLYFIVLQVATSVLMLVFVKGYEYNVNGRFIVNENGELIDVQKTLRLIFYIDLLAIALCPMVIFSITFYRLLRNLYLINVIGFSLYNKKNQSVWMFVFLLFYIVMWSGIEFSGGNFERLVLPLFYTNIYFN